MQNRERPNELFDHVRGVPERECDQPWLLVTACEPVPTMRNAQRQFGSGFKATDAVVVIHMPWILAFNMHSGMQQRSTLTLCADSFFRGLTLMPAFAIGIESEALRQLRVRRSCFHYQYVNLLPAFS